MRFFFAFLLPVLLSAQFVDDRNLFELMQDDLNTAEVHARISPEQRSVLDRSTIALVKAAAKQRARKAFDKAEVKQALKDIKRMEEGAIFRPEDRKILARDREVLELGMDGKVALDAPRRAAGSVY